MSDPTAPPLAAPPEQPAPAGGPARCAAHPWAAAAAACARCGTFVCGACATFGPTGVVCHACTARLRQTGAAPWVAITSAGLGFMSIGFVPLAMVAIVLAIVDLVRGAAKGSPAGGRKLDLIGIGLSVFAVVVWVLIIHRLVTDPEAVRRLAEE